MWNGERLMEEAGVTAEGRTPASSELAKAMSAGADFRVAAFFSYRGKDLIDHMKQIWASLDEAREKWSEEKRAKEGQEPLRRV